MKVVSLYWNAELVSECALGTKREFMQGLDADAHQLWLTVCLIDATWGNLYSHRFVITLDIWHASIEVALRRSANMSDNCITSLFKFIPQIAEAVTATAVDQSTRLQYRRALQNHIDDYIKAQLPVGVIYTKIETQNYFLAY